METRSTTTEDGASSLLDGAHSVPADVETQLERILTPHLPPEVTKRPAVVQRITREVAHVIVEQFSGPMPHPLHLNAYEQVLPGASDRILSMTEQEQDHRHQWENKVVRGQFILALSGVLLGFLVSMALIGSALYLAMHDKTAVAMAMLTVGAVSMVASFIKGRNLFDGPKPTSAPPTPAPTKKHSAKKK